MSLFLQKSIVQKPIQGYIYATNTTTDEGEIIPSINVLDVPAYQADSSGNEPFITQFSNSLKQDYPEDWAKPEIQELYAQLNKTLSESKPLPEYNVGAQVYSVYDDSSAIPVNSNGHFEDSVLTETTDNNVKLEVALGEDSYTEVETLPSSNILSSSEATNAELKSCPEKIFAFPGEIVIFRVTANGLNLKSAGLKFVLDNPSIGCVTQPVYLCIFSEKKYQTSYGCLYVKNGLNTPIDTTITAITNSGLSLKIFTEVLKKTGTISGTVFTGDMPLVKGKVKSLGPKACCKLDSAGNYYILPKVFLGHERSVIAIWQTEENGHKVKHREEKVIDFFSSDLAGFNFGVPPTPTPTFTPSATPTMSDSFTHYSIPMKKVNKQYYQWKYALGQEEAIEKTVKWLNGQVSEVPIPEHIVKAIRNHTQPLIGSPNSIIIYFDDGFTILFGTDEPVDDFLDITPTIPTPNNINKEIIKKQNKATTFRSDRILVLCPVEWRTYEVLKKNNVKMFQWDIVDDLRKNYGYNIDVKRTSLDTLDITYPAPEFDPNGMEIPTEMTFRIKDPNNMINLEDFTKMKDYGVIVLISHFLAEGGVTEYRVLCENDPNIYTWMRDNYSTRYPNNEDGLWYLELTPYINRDTKHIHFYYTLDFTQEIFKHQDFSNSFVYLNICFSMVYQTIIMEQGAKACLAFSKAGNIVWANKILYEFFSYLTGNINSEQYSPPYLSIGDAYKSLHDNPDPIVHSDGHQNGCKLMVSPDPSQLLETYFPAPVTITVEQAKGENYNEK